MISPKSFHNFFKKKVNLYSGVPDSILKNFINYIDLQKDLKNIVAANEGSAVAIAIGNFLATKKLSLVYMQNSGLGNAINPLISLAHKKVYSIPMVLLIGWRGSPGEQDEPQHNAMGAITKNFLSKLGIRTLVLKKKNNYNKINKLINFSKKKLQPVAILVKKNLFKNENIKQSKKNSQFTRYDFLQTFLKNLNKKDYVISSTGFASREIMELRKIKNNKLGKCFYLVGGMGHTFSLSLSFAMRKNNFVYCIDGDGSNIMHLGSFSNLVDLKKKNFKYFLINNKQHESVGGLRTNSAAINYKKLSKSFGFEDYFIISNKEKLNQNIKAIMKMKKKIFIEVIVAPYSPKELIRPKNLIKIKNKFTSKN